ncbi:MAG: S-layer homology domain-containing protein [Oscillospiraceae bacterium]|nr:S-layer homology domain-containing protein [Oscillospiraceae bacterium]
MNKNLKKVISAFAALTLSASSIAAFAVDFSDVDSSADYYQAVQELSALDIISGYTDGTFQPDGLVTRAEITKMIVDALDLTSIATSSMSSDTGFTDVTASNAGGHWASGYIVAGTSNGFISGMGDGTFSPDTGVTFVQAQSMLVRATGYETYASANGGWPNGYKTWAGSLGITDGVSASDDDELTRAQVAQMIANAMDAPVVIVKSYSTNVWGELVPDLEIQDGTGSGYQTLFTKYHDAYKVYGRVTATSKSGTVDTDKVDFQVEKADNFDDQYVTSTTNYPEQVIEAYIGDTDAVNQLNVYSQALIQKDDNDEYTLLSLVPAASNKLVELQTEDVDDSKTTTDDLTVMYFYPSGSTSGSTKYSLADEVTYYVNGVEMGTWDEDALNTYVLDDDTNTITLQKTTVTGSTSTSSKYDTIFVTTYSTAVVESVSEKSSYVQVTFKEQSSGLKTNMKLYTDDDSYTYSFELDGEAIDVLDLEENDVLSIAWDASAGFADSTFYDVMVSRDTVSSVKCTSTWNTSGYATLGGTKYKAASGMDITVELSTEYDLLLDVFGGIAYADENSSTKKIGILSSVYQKSNGDYVAELITKDGEDLECKLDDDYGEELYDKYVAIAYENGSKLAKLESYPNLVGEYKVNSSSKLTSFTFSSYAGGEDQTYKESSSKIGAVRISDSTVILDLTQIDAKSTYSVISASLLNDGVVYTAYGYDKSTSDSAYRFVIITDGMNVFDSTAQLAIFLEAGTDVDENDDEVDIMTVAINGEETTVVLDDDCEGTSLDDLEEGDAIVYVESAGYVIKLEQVFATTGFVYNATYSSLVTKYIANADDGDDLSAAVLANTDFADLLTDSDEDVDITFGVLVKNGNATALATTLYVDSEGVYVNLDTATDLATSGAQVYTYNFSNSSKNFGRIVLDDGLMTTPDVKAAYLDGDKDNTDHYYLYYFDDEANTDAGVADSIVFAAVRTFDTDEAQEIYQIVAE